jgi:hypothetical protein
MTQYNSVSGVRFGLQVATAALFYAAARYKKVDGLTTAASRIGLAVVMQGVSQKFHSPLGERSKINWLVDGIALGLVAYGMSYTNLNRRTKALVGGTIFGSQLAVSNFSPHTALVRISNLENKKDCQDLCTELMNIFKNFGASISPKKGVDTCKAFFQKSFPLYGGTPSILNNYRFFLNRLEGWEKVKAHMEFIEMLDGVGHIENQLLEDRYFAAVLGGKEEAQLKLWMEEVGTPIKLRWLTRTMEKSRHQEVSDAITQYIGFIGDRVTVAQKIELCEEFFTHSWRAYAFDEHKRSPAGRMLKFHKNFIEGLEGIEKAKAHMDYAEFLSKLCNRNAELRQRVVISLMGGFFAIPGIRKTLDQSGKAQVDAWMTKTGNGIRAQWEGTYREAKSKR